MNLKSVTVGAKLHWDGKWDLVAVGPDSSIWSSTLAGTAIERQTPGGDIVSYALPVRSVVPSIAPGANVSPEEYEHLSTLVRRPSSKTTLDDGSLVFIVVEGGNSIGDIPASN